MKLLIFENQQCQLESLHFYKMLHLSATQISNIVTQNKCKLLRHKGRYECLKAYYVPNSVRYSVLLLLKLSVVKDLVFDPLQNNTFVKQDKNQLRQK